MDTPHTDICTPESPDPDCDNPDCCAARYAEYLRLKRLGFRHMDAKTLDIRWQRELEPEIIAAFQKFAEEHP